MNNANHNQYGTGGSDLQLVCIMSNTDDDQYQINFLRDNLHSRY